MTDLNWFGNTEYDTESGFLYFIKPNQVHSWQGLELESLILTISTLLLNLFIYVDDL